MRVIDANLGEVRTVAVSADGRFVAASGSKRFGVFHWATGEVRDARSVRPCEQIAFGSKGDWTAHVFDHRLYLWGVEGWGPVGLLQRDPAQRFFAGGVAVSPDGKTLVATTGWQGNGAKLERWGLPAQRPISGYDDWQPFSRLAFSPDGEFLAGIWNNGFELRFAASGGIDYRHRMTNDRDVTAPGFVSFDRNSGTCAFGWRARFHVLDISTGTSRPVREVPAEFRDAAFLPSGQGFATVDDDGQLKLWNPRAWEVVREYDWDCGALTALAFTADGTAGVCGTADGRLVQFDIDE